MLNEETRKQMEEDAERAALLDEIWRAVEKMTAQQKIKFWEALKENGIRKD